MIGSRLLQTALVAAGYFIAGKAGLSLASINQSTSAVWPPTGIALAAFLILGRRVWPAVLLAAFLVNWTTTGVLATSLFIAAGNLLEGLAAAWLVERFAGGREAFRRPKHVFLFALSAAGAALISALIGALSLSAGGLSPWSRFGAVWLTWWLGDLTGALLIAPLVLLWARERHAAWPARRAAEAGLLLACSAAAGALVFLGSGPFDFACMPLVVWAAFRFRQRETMTVVCLLAGIALYGALHGRGPFAGADPNVSLLVLQAFMAALALTGLILGALLASNTEAKTGLKRFQREKEALQRDFLATISHELRTPIAAIKGFAETLRCGGLDDKKNRFEFVCTIEKHADRLAMLVDDLLTLSTIDAGKLQARPEPIVLRPFVEKVADSLSPLARRHDISVEVEISSEVRVLIDFNHLTQILQNLLGNAIKFNRPNGTVRVTAAAHGEGVRIRVADTGVGIPAAALPLLFTRFQRAGSVSRIRGSGLGLHIVKNVAEANGAVVDVESREGEGASFYVTVPKPAESHPWHA